MVNLKADIRKTRVNSVIGILFIGSFALWAGLIIWETSFGYNPLTRIFEQHYAPIVQALKEQ